MHDDSAYAANFVVAHADTGGGRRALVGAHREHPLPSPLLRTRATSRNAATATASSRNPSTGLGQAAADRAQAGARPDVDAEDRRLRDRRRRAARAPRAVVEAELLDRDGRRERHDREAHAAHAQRGGARDEAERGGDRDAARSPRAGSRCPPRRSRCDTVKPATPASATCTSDTWPDEAGDDDERQADDHAGDRDGQRVAVVERHDEQRDDDRRRRRRSPAGRGASAAGPRAGRVSMSSPRVGRLEPRHHSATTMTRNVSIALTPGSATPPSVGNQLCVCA